METRTQLPDSPATWQPRLIPLLTVVPAAESLLFLSSLTQSVN